MANPAFTHPQRTALYQALVDIGWTTPSPGFFIGGWQPYAPKKLPPSLLSVDAPPAYLPELLIFPAEDNAAYYRSQRWPRNKSIVSVDNPPAQDDERVAVIEVIQSIWNAPVQPLPQSQLKIAATSIVSTTSTADWLSQGVATATFVGTAADTSAWNAVAVATASFVGAGLDAADWLGTGISTAQFVGMALNASTWTSTGVATATWNEASFASAEWNAIGSGSASWIGASTGVISADWLVAGISTASFVGSQPSASTVARDGRRPRIQIDKRRRKDEEEIMAIAKAVLPLLRCGIKSPTRIHL